jgi:hypothetical protein
MSNEDLTLKEKVQRLERDKRELEDNYFMTISPSGKVGKKLKELEKRVIALEKELAKRGTRAEARENKQTNK